MKLMKRIFVALLILLTFNLYFPNVTFAGQALTKHPLETRSTPEEEIPVEVVKKKSHAWLWTLLGIAVIGGAVAAGSSGGGEKESAPPSPEPEPEPSGETGDVTYTW